MRNIFKALQSSTAERQPAPAVTALIAKDIGDTGHDTGKDAGELSSANLNNGDVQLERGADDTRALWCGLLGTLAASLYALRTGHRVERADPVELSAQLGWVSTKDVWRVIGAADVQILLCEVVAGCEYAKWPEGLSPVRRAEVVHILMAIGYQAADVAIVVRGQGLVIHRVAHAAPTLAAPMQTATAVIEPGCSEPMAQLPLEFAGD